MKNLLVATLLVVSASSHAAFEGDDWDSLHGQRERHHADCMNESMNRAESMREEFMKRKLVVDDSEAAYLFYFYCIKERTDDYIKALSTWLNEDRKAL